MADERRRNIRTLNPVADPDRLVALSEPDPPAHPVLRAILEQARTTNNRPQAARSGLHREGNIMATLTPPRSDDVQDVQRRRGRHRWVLVAAGIAVLLLVVAGVLTTSGPGPGPEPASEPDAERDAEPAPEPVPDPGRDVVPREFEGFGQAPTADTLAGMWVADANTVGHDWLGVFLFGTDGTHATASEWGDLDRPDSTTTVALDGDTVTLTFTGGDMCARGESQASRVGLSPDGRALWEELTTCAGWPVGTLHWWTRISPATPAGTSITASTDPDTAQPVPSTRALRGIWLLEGSGRVLYVSADDTYQIDDEGQIGIAPDDAGTIELLEDGRLVLVSSAASNRCAEGDVMVLDDAERLRATFDHGLVGDTALLHGRIGTVLQATVAEDACGDRAGTTQTWLQILGLELPPRAAG